MKNEKSNWNWLEHPRAFSFIILIIILIWKFILKDAYHDYF